MKSKCFFAASFFAVLLCASMLAAADAPTSAGGGGGGALSDSSASGNGSGAVAAIQQQTSNAGASRVLAIREQYRAAKADYQQAKNAYIEARHKAVQAKTEYNETKTKWIDAKRAYLAAANATNAGELRKAAIQQGNEFLLKQLDRMISHLGLVKSKVESMEVLGEDEAVGILTDIDEDLATLADIRARAENVTDAGELHNLSLEAKAAWIDARKGVARAAGKIEQAKEEELIDKVRDFTQRIENAIRQLEKRGVDTAEANALLESYKNKLLLAQGELEAARGEFAAGNSEKGRSHVREAHRYTIEAHNELKNIVREVKNSIQLARRAGRNSGE